MPFIIWLLQKSDNDQFFVARVNGLGQRIYYELEGIVPVTSSDGRKVL